MNPYVSFVTWGRNDGYTMDYVERVTAATRCLALSLEEAGLESEIIISEWNPPPDRPLLLDVLKLPASLRHVTIRGVIAGPEFHRKFVGAHERGIHGGEAANAGIRRARGRFVTPKASDTFISPPAIAMIAKRDLSPDAMYRLDRYDVNVDGKAIWDLEPAELFETLAQLPFVRHQYLDQLPQWRLPELHTNACGDFLLMGAGYWHLLRGHPFDNSVLLLDADSLIMHAAAAHGVKEVRWTDPCRIYKPMHGNLNNVRITPVWKRWQRILDRFLSEKVNVGAAHRARTFFDYPRRHVRGVKSVLGPSTERNFALPASRWSQGTYPIPTQPEDWGLAGHALEERVLCRASWDRAAATTS
jgi:hypothetical protein